MALLVCNNCTTKYAAGLPYCPQCTSTDHREDGEDMAKITVHGGPSNDVVDPLDGDSRLPSTATGEAGQGEAEDQAVVGHGDYQARTVKELQAEIRRRNDSKAADEERLAVAGSKDELVARLEADDQAQVQAEADGQGERV